MNQITGKDASVEPDGAVGAGDGGSSRRLLPGWARDLGPSRLSIVYLYAAGFILFSVWIPSITFV